jgi:hypothetical protein
MTTTQATTTRARKASSVTRARKAGLLPGTPEAAARAAKADTHGPAVWATTKGLVRGDMIASGQPKAEPLPSAFATVASVVMKSAGHKVITLEGGKVFSLGGVATKVWIRRLTADAIRAKAAAKATAKRELLADVKAGPGTGKAIMAAVVAATPAKAPRAGAVPAGTTYSAAASYTGKDAERTGEAVTTKGLEGYVVRWAQKGYDVVRRTEAAPASAGKGAPWAVRCNAHGAWVPANGQGEAFKLARQGGGLAAWCPGHAATK